MPDPQAMRALVDAMAASGTTTPAHATPTSTRTSGCAGSLAVAELARRGAGRVDVQQVAFPQHGLLSLPGTAELLDEAMRRRRHGRRRARPGAEGDAAAYLDVVLGTAARHDAAADLHLHAHGADGSASWSSLVEHDGRAGAAGPGGGEPLLRLRRPRRGSRPAGWPSGSPARGIGVVTAAPYSFPVPPLRLLAAAGVVTGIGHDGIRDLWGPYGTGDLLERARHVAYRSAFRRDDDIELVLRAATVGGRELLTGDRRGVEPGAVADLVVVPATNAAEVVVLVPERRAVVKRGVVSRAAGPPAPPPGPPER